MVTQCFEIWNVWVRAVGAGRCGIWVGSFLGVECDFYYSSSLFFFHSLYASDFLITSEYLPLDLKSCFFSLIPQMEKAPSAGVTYSCKLQLHLLFKVVYKVSIMGWVVFYLRLAQRREPSWKPVVTTVRPSSEKDTLRTPPRRHEWHHSSQ